VTPITKTITGKYAVKLPTLNVLYVPEAPRRDKYTTLSFKHYWLVYVFCFVFTYIMVRVYQ